MLTAKKVEREKRPGRYHDGHGLYLQVVNANNKSFLLRYERDGRERWYGLGPTHTVTLKDARERARAARLLLLDGVDPIDHRKAERARLAAARAKALTFREAAERYHAQHESKWRNRKHAAQFLSTLKAYAYPVLGNMAVSDVDTPAVLRAIEPHWLTKTETMSRVRGRIESVLDWCTVRGHRSGDNPARWRGHLAEVLPGRQVAKIEHHAALPYHDIPAFMAALRKREGTAARALEFAILSAARTGEVIGAKWPEVSFADKTWTVPPGRMKGGKQHRVPLSERAVELLQSLPTEADNEFVFIGPRPGCGLSNMALTAVLRRMGYGHVTVHGTARSSFRDWSAECSNYPNHIVEMALAHAVNDKVEAAYRRGDLLSKRRQLAEAWARYCCSPAAAGAVVPLRERRGG